MTSASDGWFQSLERDAPTHRARVKRMMELGQEDALKRAPILEALNGGSVTARMLAMYSGFTSRDSALVLRGLSDSSRIVRGVAMKIAPLALSDDEFQDVALNLPETQVLTMLHGWRRAKRSNVPIDAALELALDARRGLLLLPFASSGRLAAHVSLLSSASANEWRRVAHPHPEFIFEHLRAALDAASGFEARLIWQFNAVLPILTEAMPDKVLELLPLALRHASIGQLELQPIADRRPQAVAALVTATADRANVNWQRRAHLLDDATLETLLERENLPDLTYCLRRSSPERRRRLYERFSSSWRDADGAINLNLLRLLPGDLRQLEGRHHLALPALAARPQGRLPYAELLPWDEAQSFLEPFIKHPDPTLRQAAASSLLGTVRFERARAGDALEFVRFRKNEQDPIRLVMMGQLSALPVATWKEQHLEGLGQTIRDALDAADLSHTTASYAQNLVGRLLPTHPTWAIGWLSVLIKERGSIQLYDIGHRLTDPEAQRLSVQLLPVLRSWFSQQREAFLLQAIEAFGPRLPVLENFADLLETLVHEASYVGNSAAALRLLREHHRARFVRLATALIQKDESWILEFTVLEFLHHQRQDLLTPFLPGKILRGRLAHNGRAKYILPLMSGFQRWTVAQQQRFAQTLEAVTGTERDMPSLFVIANQLAAIPEAKPDRIVEIAAGGENIHAGLRDTALRALGRLEEGRGLPYLLAALGDDRARIAIYALRRTLLEMPASTALATLRDVPQQKVTVTKEVVRLIGDLRTPEARVELLARAATPLHRDVRVAVLRALWEHLESSDTWAVLNDAASSGDAAVAGGVIRVPAERLSPGAQRRLVSLLVVLLGHPDLAVRTATLARLAFLPVTDRERALLQRFLERLNSTYPDETRHAAAALFATYSSGDAEAIADAVRAILQHRPALKITVATLEERLVWQRARLEPVARAFVAALEEDALTAHLRVSIALLALPWPEVAAFLARLGALGQLHFESLSRGVESLRNIQRDDQSKLFELETALRDAESENLRRVALEALLRTPGDWDSERLERLNAYRQDGSSMIASAAQFYEPVRPARAETEDEDSLK